MGRCPRTDQVRGAGPPRVVEPVLASDAGRLQRLVPALAEIADRQTVTVEHVLAPEGTVTPPTLDDLGRLAGEGERLRLLRFRLLRVPVNNPFVAVDVRPAG